MCIQVVTILEVSWIMLPWTFMHNPWLDMYLLLLSDRYLEEELLDHIMPIFFNEKLFSNTSTVSYVPSSHVGYSFPHSCQPLFPSTYYSCLCGYEVVSYHNFGLHFPNNIQKTKIMASSPNTSLQIDGETMETVIDFMFMDSKITADGDCSHEIKRCLLLGRKAMINLFNMTAY